MTDVLRAYYVTSSALRVSEQVPIRAEVRIFV